MEPEGETSVQTAIEDERIWKEDGNVVVSAGTNPKLLFKCHWSMLSAIPVLQGIRSCPHLGSDGQYQGLPVLHLPDPPEDVRALLRILYDGTLIPRELRAVDTVARIGGAMRLAKKYDMEDIFACFALVLKKDWPHTYRDWEYTEHCINERLEMATPPDWNYLMPPMDENDFRPDPAQVIRLAQDVEFQCILPAAFYELYKWYPCEWPVRELVVNENIPLRVQDNYLSTEALKRLLLGKTRIAGQLHDDFECIESELDQWTCYSTVSGTKSSCSHNLKAAWARLVESFHQTHLQVPRDPLLFWLECENAMGGRILRGEIYHILPKICSDCRRRFAIGLSSKKEDFWDSLPTLFGLDNA